MTDEPDATHRDSTPHPPAPSALLDTTTGGKGGSPSNTSRPPPEKGVPSGSPGKSTETGPIHVLATYGSQADVLAGTRRAISWVRLSEDAAKRALLPDLHHVFVSASLNAASLKRLDDLTLDEALDVIRRLADELHVVLDQRSASA